MARHDYENPGDRISGSLTMIAFQIIPSFTEADYRRRPQATASFDFRVELDGSAFPTADWRDFGIVILGWWAEALVALDAGDCTAATLRFMDGPYELSAGRATRDEWFLEAYVGGDDQTLTHRVTAPRTEIFAEVARASDLVLKAAKQFGHWTKDCVLLESLTQKLHARLEADKAKVGKGIRTF